MQNNTFSTLFIGQNCIKLSSVDSTNNFLKNLLSNSEPLAEGTVIMADEQFSGRGQQQTQWQSEPGKNLTFSCYLRPIFLNATQQFYLNMAVCLGVYSAFKSLYDVELDIKWPNDIYYKDKKLGGILIENVLQGIQIKQSIIGIGLNINQEQFPTELEVKATSLYQILQTDVQIMPILQELCKQIEVHYFKVKEGKFSWLKKHYLQKLYRFNVASYYRQNEEIVLAKIVDVQENGQLILNLDDRMISVGFKEIEFIIP